MIPMNELKNKGLKEFALSKISVANRTTVLVILAIIAMAGWDAYNGMPREAFPEVIMPQIYVGTPYPGNSPVDIEKLITRPIEKEINTISGVDKITSTSIQGYSTIVVDFSFDVSPTEALRKVKDKVDIVKSSPDFPKDLPADPNIFEMNFSELMPVMNVNLSGDFSMEMLNDYAEILEDKIEGLPQISKVDIRGVQKKEVKILVDLKKMESLKIGFYDIEKAIQNENKTISGGDILLDGYRRTIRALGEFESIDEFGNIIVKQEKLNIVYLRDIAEIVFEEEERTSYAREFSQPVVMLDVIKRAGENLIIASDEINAIIAELQETTFPENLNISITSDMSEKTRTQVDELQNSILFGVILVVGVLLFFLGLRNALFVGVAIPLSMFMAFIWLNSIGVTLNMMVLFSLILALGMLVDNGIVIVENIYRLMAEGYSPVKAARYGAGEVAWPIIASTATTLAAFIPLALWPGQMGEFMQYLPMTLMIVLGSSLFVALVINPVLTSLYMKIEESEWKSMWKTVIILTFIGAVLMWLGYFILVDGIHLDQIFISEVVIRSVGTLMVFASILILVNKYFFIPGTKYFQVTLLPLLEESYKRFLTGALKKPLIWFGLMPVLLALSFLLMKESQPKVLFFPITEPAYINIFIEQPIGTDIDQTNAIASQVETIVIDYFNEDITPSLSTDFAGKYAKKVIAESIIGQVGKGTSDPMQGPSAGNSPNKARIQISFVPFKERLGISTSHVMKELREKVQDLPGVSLIVDQDKAGPPQGKPINIEVSGDDYEQLLVLTEQMKEFIDSKNILGIEDLKADVEMGKPELLIHIDRAKARRLNVSSAQIGSTLRTALFGKEVSTYKDGEDDYDIVVRLRNEDRYDIETLLNQKITFRDPSNGRIMQVPISSVVKAEKSTTFSAVKRRDLKRVISLQSNVLSDYNANEVVAEVSNVLNDYNLPEGYTWKFTGEQEEMAKNMTFLMTALAIAIFLIYLIIVSQFNKISSPVIIVLSVVFSIIGVLLGLVIFQMAFVVIMTMIGIISLAGIVVNNAIVLIDYTDLIRSRRKLELGMADDERLSIEETVNAIIEGGKTRLRPVLLTAITTVLGLVPMAVGINIDFFSLVSHLDPQFFLGGDNVIFWGPMSWTIIFGLTFATFLTLVIVPVMYLLVEQLKWKVYGSKVKV